MEDMSMQRDWCENMKTRACMFKFHMPFTLGETEYLGGNIYLQVWGPIHSAETRLIVSRKDTDKEYSKKTYDHQDYLQALYRFNRCTRPQKYSGVKEYPQIEGIPHNYDVRGEQDIMEKYVKKYGKDVGVDDVIDILERLDKILNQPLKVRWNRRENVL